METTSTSTVNYTSKHRYRQWCVTWYGYALHTTVGDPTIVDRMGKNFKYMVYQVEKCPKTDRLHLQMYVETNNPCSIGSLRKWFPGCHADKRFGTKEQARDYCMKEETRVSGPYEFGEFKPDAKGKRSDLEAVKEDIALGLTEEELWESNFCTMVKYHKGISVYRSLKAPTKTWTTMWSLYIGEPGTGKTTYANKAYPGAYWKSHTNWWDGYTGQDVVVWDEFRGQYPYGDLMRLHDPSKVLLQIKGGTATFLAKQLIFISNYTPEQWYDFAKNGLNSDSLTRRFDWIYLFVKGDRKPHVFPDMLNFCKHVMEFGLTKGDLELEEDDELDLTCKESPFSPVAWQELDEF